MKLGIIVEKGQAIAVVNSWSVTPAQEKRIQALFRQLVRAGLGRSNEKSPEPLARHIWSQIHCIKDERSEPHPLSALDPGGDVREADGPILRQVADKLVHKNPAMRRLTQDEAQALARFQSIYDTSDLDRVGLSSLLASKYNVEAITTTGLPEPILPGETALNALPLLKNTTPFTNSINGAVADASTVLRTIPDIFVNSAFKSPSVGLTSVFYVGVGIMGIQAANKELALAQKIGSKDGKVRARVNMTQSTLLMAGSAGLAPIRAISMVESIGKITPKGAVAKLVLALGHFVNVCFGLYYLVAACKAGLALWDKNKLLSKLKQAKDPELVLNEMLMADVSKIEAVESEAAAKDALTTWIKKLDKLMVREGLIAKVRSESVRNRIAEEILRNHPDMLPKDFGHVIAKSRREAKQRADMEAMFGQGFIEGFLKGEKNGAEIIAQLKSSIWGSVQELGVNLIGFAFVTASIALSGGIKAILIAIAYIGTNLFSLYKTDWKRIWESMSSYQYKPGKGDIRLTKWALGLSAIAMIGSVLEAIVSGRSIEKIVLLMLTVSWFVLSVVGDQMVQKMREKPWLAKSKLSMAEFSEIAMQKNLNDEAYKMLHKRLVLTDNERRAVDEERYQLGLAVDDISERQFADCVRSAHRHALTSLQVNLSP